MICWIEPVNEAPVRINTDLIPMMSLTRLCDDTYRLNIRGLPGQDSKYEYSYNLDRDTNSNFIKAMEDLDI